MKIAAVKKCENRVELGTDVCANECAETFRTETAGIKMQN